MWKVLLVEDNRMAMRYLKNLVDWEQEGFEITATAFYGAEGIEKFYRHRPDVVITDIQMPGMSGIELAEKIREADRDTMILFLSGYHEFEYTRSALLLDVKDYILKDELEEEELRKKLHVIREELERREIWGRENREKKILERWKDSTSDFTDIQNREEWFACAVLEQDHIFPIFRVVSGQECNVTEHLLTSFDILSGDATAEEVVAQMTLEEMAQIVCGAGASEKYRLKGIQNRGEYTDGSQGMKVDDYMRWASNSLLACSWDTELFAQQGVYIAKDGTDQETKVDFWLAPGMNLMRDPRGGRNGEYYSEDPLLTGVYGTIMIKTVQESGIAVCPKHFVANDSENERHTMMVLVSERALRELYLKPFEMAVKQAQPKGLMTAFNDINRYSGASNFDLCTNIARGEWGFEGLIMTDWDSRCHQSTMVYAGNDLIMPSGNAELILDYIRNPRIMPTGDNSLDPYYVRPTTKGMLQRNTVRIVEILSQCPSTIRMMQEEGSKI